MPSDHVVSTAELITNPQSIACPRLTSDRGSQGSSRLLNWVVDLTERAQRHMARAAAAEASVTGIALGSEFESRFVCDAAGGGLRAAEAAWSLQILAK
jgi:hypothetical protein